MSSLATAPLSSTGRSLNLRKRADLVCVQHRYQGRVTWVVKDPIGLKYHRLLAQEFALLELLDGELSLEEIQRRFVVRFGPDQLTLTELQQFIGRMYEDGLLISTTPGRGERLLNRRAKKRRSRKLGSLVNVLSIRFRGIDPQRLLDVLYPLCRWFFTRTAFALTCALMLGALLLVTLQFHVFRGRLPGFQEFFGPGNWLLLGAVIAGTKVLHEFGHGLACRHFGGRCHEIGAMLLVLTPCLYCNVSDSWLLPNKWQRMAIAAAGMYVEVALASVATFVWWFSEPGVLNHVCLQIMFVSSVSTVLFNGNPLLRYDGYYILSDWMEVPNLAQQSQSVLNRLLARWCLGVDLPEQPFLPQRRPALFALYTVAATVYRWIVLISVLLLLNSVFEPYGLKVVGQLIAAVSIAGMLIPSLVKLYQFFQVPGRTTEVKRSHLLATSVVVLLVAAGALFIPLPRHVVCPLIVQPREAELVYVGVRSRIDEVLVNEGDQVSAGQVLARLDSVDLDLEIAELSSRRQALRARLESLQDRRFADANAGEEVASVTESIAAIDEQLSNKQQLHERLTLRAARGTVLRSPIRNDRSRDDQMLPHWQGSLLDPRNGNAVVDVGDVFCQVGDPADMEAELFVDQGDVDLVSVGQAASLKFDALPTATLAGTIVTLSQREVQSAPPNLSSEYGGALATRTGGDGVQRPLHPAYSARVALDVAPAALLNGLRGRAKVMTGSQSVAGQAWRYLLHTFHFSL